MDFKPLSNYIVVEEKIHQKTTSGLVIPDTAKQAKKEMAIVDHIVVAVSEEKDENDKPCIKNVKVGDRVLLGQGSAEIMMMQGKAYIVIRENYVVGIFTGTPPQYETEPEKKSNLTLVN